MRVALVSQAVFPKDLVDKIIRAVKDKFRGLDIVWESFDRVDEASLKQIVSELREKGFEVIVILSFLGPGLLKSLRSEDLHLLSLDSAATEVATSFLNEKIAILFTSNDEMNYFSKYRLAYELTPRQFSAFKVKAFPQEALVEEGARLVQGGFRVLILGCTDLLPLAHHLEEEVVKKVGSEYNPLVVNPIVTLFEQVERLLRPPPPRPPNVLVNVAEICEVLPCISEPDKIRVIAQTDVPLSKVLPILYVHIKTSKYSEALGVLTFSWEGRLISIFAPGKISMAKVKDREDAERILWEIKGLANRAYKYYLNYGEPTLQMLTNRRDLQPLKIYNLLPKSNCGECGESTCMAFAVKLLSGEIRLDRCEQLRVERYHPQAKQLEELFKPIF